MKEIINHFFYYEFIYIFLFCSLIFLFIAVFIKQSKIRKLLLPFVSLFFVLFVFEFSLSFFMPLADMNYYKKYSNNYDINSIHKERQVKLLLPNSNIYEMWNDDINFDQFEKFELIFDKTYQVYKNGFRFINYRSDISGQNNFFLGCSFVFGLGLNDNETLPYYFSEKFNFIENVVNCGVSGAGSNTALNILNNEIFLKLIRNGEKIRFFYCFISDHILRNFSYENSNTCVDGYLYKKKKWYIPTTIGKIKYMFARSYIFRKVFIPIIDEKFKRYYENYMIESLKEMNKIVEEKYKSKLTIIIWEKDGFCSDYFINKLKQTNLDLIFLPEYFNSEEKGYRIKYDLHPTAKANKEIAEMLYNHINNLNQNDIALEN